MKCWILVHGSSVGRKGEERREEKWRRENEVQQEKGEESKGLTKQMALLSLFSC
jgi:hypothetical protein